MTVVVYTPDVVGERMAGPGIRAYEFARELAKTMPTQLIARLDNPDAEPFAVHELGSTGAARALKAAQVIISQPNREALAASRRGQQVIFDLISPVPVELRELYRGSRSVRKRIHLFAETRRFKEALSRGRTFITGSTQQKEFYSSRARAKADWLNVPFGIDRKPPRPSASHDRHLGVWGGGLWRWLDPELAIEATVETRRRGTPVQLLLLGGARPNVSRVVAESRAIDGRLATAGGAVIRNETWVPYRERDQMLTRCRFAIALHRRTAEAEISVRTRLFDALWCSLPIITTAGGYIAGLVRDEELGLVVPAGEIAPVVSAIEQLVTDDQFHDRCVRNIERVRERFYWDRILEPLVAAVRRLS